MAVVTLSLKEARRRVLDAQGLGVVNSRSKPVFEASLTAIRQLGYVQIDTISVVERAHHHTLWARVPSYDRSVLGRLLSERRVFEYWSHAAAFLPIEDFRYALPRMRRHAEGVRHWFAREKRVMKFVLDRIRAEGPLMARDFEAPRGHVSGNWFKWKPAKRALEQLFIDGSLSISRREGFQKVFDLTDRVIPADVDRTMPTPDEFVRHLVLRGLGALGLARAAELGYLRKGYQSAVKTAVAELVEDGSVVPVRVRGLADPNYYALPETLESAVTRARRARVRILSPFDNLVIQRRRLLDLFAFDYQIECYVPEPKRQYGYFTLPLLYGDTFAGRLDAKADRAARVLELRHLHFEPAFDRDDAFLAAFGEALEAFARFNGCDRVRLHRVTNARARDLGSFLFTASAQVV